ncbi:hypothetical protein P3W23_00365 [Luteibacter sp. PPL554]
MKGQFYAVYIKPSPDASADTIKEAMNKSLDWYRVSENFWIVYTARNAEVLYKRLKPSVKDPGRVFISRLDLTDRQGWMAKGFWTWLKKERE